MIMLSLAADANAQCVVRTNRTIVRHGAVAAVSVAPAPVVVAARGPYAAVGAYPVAHAPVGAYPATYAPVGVVAVTYRQVITPAPVAIYAPPQVVYSSPVIVTPATVFRTYAGHTRIITHGGHGHGRRHAKTVYRSHRSSRHGRRGVRVNFGLRIGR